MSDVAVSSSATTANQYSNVTHKLQIVNSTQPPKTSTAQNSKQREFNFGFDETMRDTGTTAINESKLAQYQEVIKKVRLGMDEMG